MKQSTVKQDMKSKKGVEIKAGERVKVSPHENDMFVIVETDDGRKMAMRSALAFQKLTGFNKMPSMKTLEKWTFDSVCKSITGKTVEPDGHGPDGFPSWFLALGMM